MSYQQQIFELIRAMTGQNNLLTIPRAFIDYTGDLEAALFLSQLIYWTDKSQNDGWIYKTYQEWENEIGLNEYKVRKAKTKLENMGILDTKIKKANGCPVVHYRLDTIKFSESFLQNLKNPIFKNYRMETSNIAETLTETTTNTTTEITTNSEYIHPQKNTKHKIKYAEFVSMTEEEYSKLIAQYGEEITKRMIEILDNYKGATGKRYKSDYRAILNWVIDRVQKEMRENGLRNASKEDTGGIKLKIPVREYQDYTEEELRKAGLI
ncbi:hypothetical protein [Caloramator sp. ALD01]|uniref:hypothetical protein n=1 Tax=Caloramator sp. ALD01 TaxID=1031288 RepID=UPI000419EF33|nr:hypothetical protein [Caloramator sp. ALD01]